nr:LOW QUALITY PROTEIN: uncharacterized protein LOC106028113 [Cavia porcellus]
MANLPDANGGSPGGCEVTYQFGQAEGHQGSVAMAFIGQSAPDIRCKLQRLDGLQDLTLRDLVKEAEKVYYKPETEEEKEQVEGTPVDFEVDTGAVYSALQVPLGSLSSKNSLVQGANGSQYRPWTTERIVDLGKGNIKHSFLVIPECPAPLLGRDLLTKLGATISFESQGPRVTFHDQGWQAMVTILSLKMEDEYRLYEEPKLQSFPPAWLTDFRDSWAEMAGLGLASQEPPVVVTLKATATPIRVKQYPISKEAHQRDQKKKKHIHRLLDLKGLTPCRSAWNTLLLLVKKPGTNDYWPVQDLREVNSRVEDIHPTVPNPYNLLSGLSGFKTWYTVLDLKDAFFCLPLHKDSQPLLAFEWTYPDTVATVQMTWTRLPQGFKNSPTIFDEALHKNLVAFRAQHADLTLLQYVDDLLLAADTESKCVKGTQALLRKPFILFIEEKNGIARGVLTQTCGPWKRPVAYLSKRLDPVANGWPPCLKAIAAAALLNRDADKLTLGQKLTIIAPHTLESIICQPSDRWIALPNIGKPFILFIEEKNGIARGVLTQTCGPWKRPVAYLSKRLDPVANG